MILNSITYKLEIGFTLLGLIGVRVVKISEDLCLQPLHRLSHYEKRPKRLFDKVKGGLI